MGGQLRQSFASWKKLTFDTPVSLKASRAKKLSLFSETEVDTIKILKTSSESPSKFMPKVETYNEMNQRKHTPKKDKKPSLM